MRFFTTKPFPLLSILSILSFPTLAMEDGPETHPPLSPRTSARLDAYPALFEEINHYGKNNIQIYRRLNVFFEEHIPNIEEFRTQLELAKTAETLRPSTISYVSNILESIRPIIISDTSRTKQKSSSRFSKMKGLPPTLESSEPTISEREHPMLFAKTIIDSLNEVIIGEQKAMRELGTYISRNEGVISVNEELLKEGHKRPINKTSILLKGPSGCGKTACIKQLAKILNVPFYIADSSTFTRTGFRGDSASFVIEELLRAANYNIERAERGIVFFDELDKKGDISGSNIAGADVQSEMLKLIEGKNVPVTLFPGTPHEISVMMNTQNIRFIGGGTFSRLPPENIPTVQDFVNIGFSKELLGRFGKIIFFEGTTEEKLLQILQSPFVSPIEDEKILLERKYNAKVNFTAKALQRIAKKASQLDTGVRGLSTVVEQTTESIITESSGQDQTITIDEKYVNEHVPEIVRKTPAWGALYGNF